MADLAAIYRDTRERTTDLIRAATPEQIATRCPAAPEWTVHDTLAHLSGVTVDIINGNLDGVATDDWTAAQVEPRRSRTTDDLLDEWNEYGPQVEALADALPIDPVTQMITDAATHEHDIRGALQSPGAKDSSAVEIAVPWMSKWLGQGLAAGGAGPLAIEMELTSLVAGDSEPVATVRVERFELFRGLTGRRSLDQIRSWEWSGDSRPELIVLKPLFTARPEALVE